MKKERPLGDRSLRFGDRTAICRRSGLGQRREAARRIEPEGGHQLRFGKAAARDRTQTVTRRVQIDVLGIPRGILPAEVADVLRRNVLPVVDRKVGDIDQIQGRLEDEILHSGQFAEIALGDAHEFVRPGIVGIRALGEEGVDADRIERQRRRSRQTPLVRTVDAGGGPHHARKLLERQRLGAVLAPRTTGGQRLTDGRSAHRIGGRKDDLGAVFHFGPALRGLLGRRDASARRQQQRGTGKQFRFHSLAFFSVPGKNNAREAQ